MIGTPVVCTSSKFSSSSCAMVPRLGTPSGKPGCRLRGVDRVGCLEEHVYLPSWKGGNTRSSLRVNTSMSSVNAGSGSLQIRTLQFLTRIYRWKMKSETHLPLLLLLFTPLRSIGSINPSKMRIRMRTEPSLPCSSWTDNFSPVSDR